MHYMMSASAAETSSLYDSKVVGATLYSSLHGGIKINVQVSASIYVFEWITFFHFVTTNIVMMSIAATAVRIFIGYAASKAPYKWLKASMVHYTPHLEENHFTSVDLDGVEGEPSGIRLNTSTMQIAAIEVSSQLAEHNRREPEMAIHIGDRVVQVNGKTAGHVEEICNDLREVGMPIALTVASNTGDSEGSDHDTNSTSVFSARGTRTAPARNY